MTKRFCVLIAAFAIVGLTSACGSSTSSPSPAAADVTVQMVGDKGSQSYSPNPTTMKVGQTIAWHNADTIAHTSTKDGGGFDTGSINGGATSAPIAMSTAGTFTYHCTLHPGMVGTITVQ